MRKHTIVKMVGISIAVFIASITGCTINSCCGRNFNHHVKKQCNISSAVIPGGRLFTDLTYSDVTVIGQNTSECTVDAELTVSATSQEIADSVAEQLRVELVEEAGRLAIVIQKPAEYANDYNVSSKMNITVPMQTYMDINTTHGNCRFEDIQRDMTVKTTHGNLQIDGISGTVTAATTHGNINVANTHSPSIQANSTHGKISLSDCDVPKINCCTTHARIALKMVSADTLNLQTSHGPIELTGCTAKEAALNTTHGAVCGDVNAIQRLSACTSHAPIRLQCVNDANPDITIALNTTHNNIKFIPPTGYAGQVSTSTTHGSIHSDLPILVQGTISEDRINGTIGEGTGSIALNTTHGNIKLKSAE